MAGDNRELENRVPSWLGQGRRATRRFYAIALVLWTLTGAFGCNEKEVEKWFPENSAVADAGPILFEAGTLDHAIRAFKASIRGPIQALSLLVYPDHVVLQAQDSMRPGQVDQYVYRNGQASEPVPVKLMGKGKLEDNLFPLEAANLAGVPELVREAKQQVDIPEGKVTRVLLKRNLPESMDIQFRVFITSQRRDGYVDADKDGNVLSSKP